MTKSELGNFLIKRGLWLILIEITVISLGWTFNPFFNVLILQVIWATGISMVLLGIFVRFSYGLVLSIGSIDSTIPQSTGLSRGGSRHELLDFFGTWFIMAIMDRNSLFILLRRIILLLLFMPSFPGQASCL